MARSGHVIVYTFRSHFMRPQEHAKISAIAAAVTLPWLKKDVWIPYTSSILIDIDHYAWYALTQRSLNLRQALHFFRNNKAPRGSQVRILHQPAVLGLLLFVAVLIRSRLLALIVAGMAFHVCLDRYHQAQMHSLYRTIVTLAGYTCQQCGQPKGKMELQLHTLHTPQGILDKYNPDNYIALCPPCHIKAHQPPSPDASSAMPDSFSLSSK